MNNLNNVSGYLERKSLLYRTGVEYGGYTINHVQGCAHGCKYPCYAFLMAKRFGRVKSYDDWIKPKLVSNTMDILKAEIPKYRGKVSSVHLCFTTDPFMYGFKEICDCSLEIIKLLNNEGISCTVLTKGLLPLELITCSKANQYGVTLISMNEKFREKMEPGAAPYHDRINRLKVLHDAGCQTWVSIEPYPTPNILTQNYDEILNEVSFVDKIIFGRMHYNSMITKYKDYKNFYNDLSIQTIKFCRMNNIRYHIKKGTLTCKCHELDYQFTSL